MPSAVARTETALDAIARHNPRTNAFILVDADAAREQARACDAERRRGVDRGPLHGVPVSLKDLIDVRGRATTAGSRVLAGNLAAADAPIVTRLRAAGAVLIGKTNLHEFALGTTSEHSGFGPTRHPRDPARSPGGSSGGSAVSVVTGMAAMSVGTDTGGSIRIPAAICGCVGLKPSRGDVPADGVVPLSTTFDHVGPIAASVADAAALWAVLAERSAPVLKNEPAEGLRFAALGGAFATSQPGVDAPYRAALDRLRQAGVSLVEAGFDSAAAIHPAYVDVVLYEAAAWHAPYLDTRRELYSPAVHARLLAGRDVSIDRYEAALAACSRLAAAVDAIFETTGADALVLPTVPVTAPVLGADEVDLAGGRVNVRTAMLRNTQLFNMTGHPAISLPLAVADGWPAGVQLVGRRGATAALLAIASRCEKIVC